MMESMAAFMSFASDEDQMASVLFRMFKGRKPVSTVKCRVKEQALVTSSLQICKSSGYGLLDTAVVVTSFSTWLKKGMKTNCRYLQGY